MERITTSEQIFRTLRKRILSMELKPGESVNVQALADELGVSKSPVRDALLKLREDNLVEILPQSGTHVSLIDMDQVRVERFLRTSLEAGAAVRFCASRTDEDLADMQLAIEAQKNAFGRNDMAMFLAYDDAFHSVLFRSLGFDRLWNIIQNQSGNYHRIRLLSFGMPQVCEDIIDKHRQMLAAFRNRSEQDVSSLEENHLGKLDDEAAEIEARCPGYFKKQGKKENL
jgi:DNA-binding GntR family transcriptional regulator